jgi:hypothetical protein
MCIIILFILESLLNLLIPLLCPNQDFFIEERRNELLTYFLKQLNQNKSLLFELSF